LRGPWPTPPLAITPRFWWWRSPVGQARPRWCSRPGAWPPAHRCRSRSRKPAHQPASGLFLSPPAPEAFRAIGRSVCLRSIHSLSPSWLFSPPVPATALPSAPHGATAVVASAPPAEGPSCSLQWSGSLWQLGIEAQELTTAIGQLAEQLVGDDPQQRASALAEWRRHSLQKGATKRPWVAIAQPRAISSMRALH